MADTINREQLNDLIDKLGPTLVAIISGTRIRGIVKQWLDGTYEPTRPQAVRLTLAFEIFEMIAKAYSDDIARAWFISEREIAADSGWPAHGLRADHFEEVKAAAVRFVNDGDGY